MKRNFTRALRTAVVRLPRYGSTLETQKPSDVRAELREEQWQGFVEWIDEDTLAFCRQSETKVKGSIPWYKFAFLDELIELEDGEADLWESIPDPYRSIIQQVKELILQDVLWNYLSLRELKVCLWLHLDNLTQRQVAKRLYVSQQAVQQINYALRDKFHRALAGKPIRKARKSATEAGSCASLLVRYHVKNPH